MAFVGKLLGLPEPSATPLRMTVSASESRHLILGKTAHAGAMVFQGLSDSKGRLREGDNRVAHRVIVLAGHRVRRLTRFWADGELVRPTPMVHGVRTEITGFRYDGKPRLYATFYDGRDDQTADPHLVSQYILPYRWRSTDRLRGCAYVVISATHSTETLTSLPNFIFELEGAYLYDRRKDSTAGGSGTQRWDDPYSWAYTDNAAVATDHYRLGIVGGLPRKIAFGMGLTPSEVPFEEFAANADLCDEIVNGRPRYAANGIIKASEDHKNVILRLSRAMSAQPVDTGGQLAIRPQQARTIKLTLTDSDLVSGPDYEFTPTPRGEDLVNTIRGTFLNPDSRYNQEDYPTVEDTELIAQDGRPFEHTFDLDLENNPERAQHLANIELEIQKRRDTIEETFMPIANVLDVGDWIERVSNLRGPVTKVYQVEKLTKHSDFTVTIEARETDPSITGWGANDAKPVPVPDAPEHITTHRPPAPILTPSVKVAEGGGARLPAVELEVTALDGLAEGDADTLEIEYGLSNGLTGEELGILEGTRQLARFNLLAGDPVELTGLLPDTTYVYRGRLLYQDLASDWTAYAELTTDAVMRVPTAGEADAIGDLSADALGQAFDGLTVDEIRDYWSQPLLGGDRLSNQIDMLRAEAQTNVGRVIASPGANNDLRHGIAYWQADNPTSMTDPLGDIFDTEMNWAAGFDVPHSPAGLEDAAELMRAAEDATKAIKGL